MSDDHRSALLTLDLAPHELNQRLLGLERLLNVTRSLAAEIDLGRVLESITVAASKALECDRATLYRFDPATEELYTSVTTELEIAEIRKGIDQGITGFVARNRCVANVPDPPRDIRWDSSVDQATGYHTQNILAAPIVSPRDGSLLGVLQLLNRRDGLFDRFDEHLLEAFCQHAAVALDRALMIEELKQQEAIQISLQVARGIQRGFMPSELPDTPCYEMASWWFPNQAVGGDYCDCLKLRDGRTALAIADVSGHGLGPSLIMASVRAGLRALLLAHSAPENLLELLNASLSGDLQHGRFITMVLAALDPVAHRVMYANAGHAPALHYQASMDRFQPLEPTGVPLGVEEHPGYHAGPVISMQVGDLLVLCTDGIVEAMDSEQNQFGVERLEGILREGRRLPVAELVRMVGANVEEHYVGETPPDDLTILAARRNL